MEGLLMARLSALRAARGKGIPVGTVEALADSTVPSGWLLCNGDAVSRTTYARLFEQIGTTYGAGDGSTTFGLPDLRGEFIRGLDAGRGVDSGRTLGSTQSTQFGQHSHPAGPLAAPHSHPGSPSTGPINLPHNHGPANPQLSGYLMLTPLGGPASFTLGAPGPVGPVSVTPSTGGAPSPAMTHSHSITIPTSPAPVSGNTGNAGDTPNSSETRPRNVAMNYIIKV